MKVLVRDHGVLGQLDRDLDLGLEKQDAAKQEAAKAAKGKARRKKIGSTRIAIAGTANHSDLVGEFAESRWVTISRMAASASAAISASNKYLRATLRSGLTR